MKRVQKEFLSFNVLVFHISHFSHIDLVCFYTFCNGVLSNFPNKALLQKTISCEAKSVFMIGKCLGYNCNHGSQRREQHAASADAMGTRPTDPCVWGTCTNMPFMADAVQCSCSECSACKKGTWKHVINFKFSEGIHADLPDSVVDSRNLNVPFWGNSMLCQYQLRHANHCLLELKSSLKPQAPTIQGFSPEPILCQSASSTHHVHHFSQ